MISTQIRILLLFLVGFKNVLCGQMEGFVVRGRNAAIDCFPHAVYLELSSTRKWICGSAVVNQDVLLTAAHCLYICVEEQCTINALAGHESLYQVSVLREVNKFKIHGHYDDVAMEYDIAIAKVSESLPLGRRSHIKRVILPSYFPKVHTARIAGWGIVNDETKEIAVTLKMTKQVIRSEDQCARYVDVNDGVFCATTPSRFGRPSEGDSGSALVTANHQQIGLVSFRMEEHPQILYYTNVTYFYNWIKDAATALYCGSSNSKFFTD